MKVTLFGKPQCPGCEASKQYLATNGVDYDYIDVTTDIGFETLQSLDDSIRSVPVLSVDKGDTIHNIVGFNKEQYDTLLGEDE